MQSAAGAPHCLPNFGWEWHQAFTIDENYMDLAILTSRNSTCLEGHMGCTLVQHVPHDAHQRTKTLTDKHKPIICAINSPMFKAYSSDCHAEANAVAECAKRGIKAEGLCCYVSKIPCENCFKLLSSAGIRRIVAPQSGFPEKIAQVAEKVGITYVQVRDSPEREERRDRIARPHMDYDRVRALREERKVLAGERKKTKREQKMIAQSNREGEIGIGL